MDIVYLLSSLNKIGLIAFLITLGFLVYEVYLLSRAGKKQEQAPNVPQFKEGELHLIPTAPIEENSWKRGWNNLTKNNRIILIILSILLVLFGVITLIGYINSNLATTKAVVNSPSQNPTRQPTYKVSSKTATPTIKLNSPAPFSPTPTEILITNTVTPEISESPEIVKTATPSSSTIEQLPVTGIIHNSLIILFIAGATIFLSLLF